MFRHDNSTGYWACQIGDLLFVDGDVTELKPSIAGDVFFVPPRTGCATGPAVFAVIGGHYERRAPHSRGEFQCWRISNAPRNVGADSSVVAEGKPTCQTPHFASLRIILTKHRSKISATPDASAVRRAFAAVKRRNIIVYRCLLALAPHKLQAGHLVRACLALAAQRYLCDKVSPLGP